MSGTGAGERPRHWQRFTLAVALLLAGPAAASAGEVTGLVWDQGGRPLPGADVVITGVGGRLRRATISDGRGRFQLPVSEPGVYLLSVYAADGAVVSSRVLTIAGRTRVELVVPLGQGEAAVRDVAAADSLPRLWSDDPSLATPAAGPDLTAALVAVPGSAAPAPPADGPVLAGTDPAEVELRLEGLRLNHPADGRAPWELPVELFGGLAAGVGMGPAWQGGTGRGSVELHAARAERWSAGGRLGTRAVAPAGEAQDSDRPRGWTAGGEGLVRASAVGASGRWRGSLAAAPVRDAWRADPGSVRAPRGRRVWLLPALGRADLALGAWDLAFVGLAAAAGRDHGRSGPLVGPGEPDEGGDKLATLGLQVRRPLPGWPGWTSELVLRGGLAGWWRRGTAALPPVVTTRARRATLAAEVSTGGALLGRHRLVAAAGLEADRARQSGGVGPRQADLAVTGSQASSATPFVAADERFAPSPWLELEAGLRVTSIFLEGRSERVVVSTIERDFHTDVLLAPRFALALAPPAGGERWRPGLRAVAGRFAGPLPLEPLLGGTAGPPFGRQTPAEDAALARLDLTGPGLLLAVTALERRAAHVVEDRFSPGTGQLELVRAVGARRRFRALTALLQAGRQGWRGALAVTRSSLRGNHDGFTDPALGLARPGATGGWDTSADQLNREGPLPYDRPWSVRLLLEHARPLAPGYRLAVMAAGRLDSGTPLSARGRSPDSGEGQLFLVERGSLGRMRAVTAVDLGAALSWVHRGQRTVLALQVANLGNHRPVVAREEIYTQSAASPVAGRGRADLARVTDPAGLPAVPRDSFGNPVAWAEPLSLRLSLGFEL